MFTLTKGQTVTIRQSIEFYKNDEGTEMEIADGPVTLEILEICETPNEDWNHYNVDIKITQGPYEGWTTNLDIDPEDIED